MAFGDLFRPASKPEPTPGEIGLVDAMMAVSKGGVFIDVRAQKDYERGHIPGAKLVDLSQLQESPIDAIWANDPLAQTDKKIVVVSATTKHAAAIAHLLRDKGFDADYLAGGLIAWARDGQPLVSGPPRS